MFDLNEEQVEEIEVLESIFADSFTQDSKDSTKFSIELNTTVGLVTLKIKLVPEYPLVLPEMEITSTSHKLVTHDLLKAVQKEAEQLVGMVMIFSVCTFIEDWISKKYKNTNKSMRLPTNDSPDDDSSFAKRPTIIEEKILGDGLPVTRATFLAWRDKFLLEKLGNLRSPAMAQLAPVVKESKWTGKQLFEQNKGLASSDAAFADDGVAIEIDESAFEGINLDDLEGEENEESPYDNRGQISDDEEN